MATPPLYPGYYPGTPQPRQDGPTGGGSQINPTEFNFDQVSRIIDGVAYDYDIASPPGATNWVAERIMDDWKQSMKATIHPDQVNAQELDDYDPASLPGAFGINVNLNPADWAKDPGKEAKKTLQGWVKAGVNWQDLETRYRQHAWEDVFSANPSANDVFLFEDVGTAALGASLAAQSGFGSGPNKLAYQPVNNPLRLEKRPEALRKDFGQGNKDADIEVNSLSIDADGKVVGVITAAAGRRQDPGTVDTMEDFIGKISKYEQQSQFGPKRDKAWDDVTYSGYRAIVTDMENKASAQAVVTANPEMQQALTSAQAHLNIYESMASVQKDLTGYNSYLKGQFESHNNLEGTKATLTQASVNKSLTAIDKQIQDLVDNGMIKEAEYLRKYTDPYKRQITEILKSDVLDPTKVVNMNASIAINKFTAQVEGGMYGKGIIDNKTFSPSYQRTLLRNMEADITRPGLRGKKTLGVLVQEVSQHDNDLASRAIVGGMVYVRNTAQISGAMEVFGALEQGKLLERYVWNRAKVYFQATTPAAYTERFLKERNYFGLVISDEDKFEKSALYGMTNAFRGKNDPPGGAFGNYFSFKEEFKGNAILSGVRVNANIYGGSHFNAVDSMSRIIKLNGMDADPAKLAAFMKIIDIDGHPGMSSAQLTMLAMQNMDKNSAFMTAFTARYGSLILPNGMKDEKILDFMGDLVKFKQWARNNHAKLGININEATDEYYLALFTALRKVQLNKDFLNITARYAGLLQKVFTKLNRLQSYILSSYIGKLIAPAAYVKKAISDAISAAISKALSIAAGGASGGVLAPLAATVEPLIRFIVRITVDKVSEYVGLFYNAVVKADVDSVFKFVDKQVDRMSKVAMIVIGAFTMLVIIPGDNFMGAVATTFPPTDNTLAAGIGDTYGTISLGTGVQIEPEESKPSNADPCFEFATYNTTITILGQTLQLSTWDPRWQAQFEKSILALKERSGGFLGRLCEKGPVKLLWAVDDHNGGYCGLALGSGSITGTETIIFGHNALCYKSSSYPEWWYDYLFAHETGHIYSYRVGMETINGLSFGGVLGGGETTMMTYPGHCGDPNLDQDEDFAETIGNWVQINTADCSTPGDYQTFWQQYPKHFRYADEVLTRP